ncbi:MAG: sigma factor-like helix-turn-helix DNA-binding protein [Mycobacterium sp.]
MSVEMDPFIIGTAFAQLTTGYRAIIRRSYYEGRTTAQIADDLHIDECAVKARLHYAMRAFRSTLQQAANTDAVVFDDNSAND